MMLRYTFPLILLSLSNANSIKMVRNFDGNVPTNPEPCLLTCVGATGSGNTDWKGEDGRVWTHVDMSECGFVDVPIVTTSLNGIGQHDYMVGMTSPFYTTKDSFTIVLLGKAQTSWEMSVNPDNISAKQPVSYGTQFKWNISWSAVGYICDASSGIPS